MRPQGSMLIYNRDEFSECHPEYGPGDWEMKKEKEGDILVKISFPGQNGGRFYWSLTCPSFRAAMPFSLGAFFGYPLLTTILGLVPSL